MRGDGLMHTGKYNLADQASLTIAAFWLGREISQTIAVSCNLTVTRPLLHA